MSEFAENISVFQAGAASERERIREIMALPEARGREGTALHLALAADVPIGSIKFILETIPAGPVPAFNVRPVRIPSHLRLAACRDLEGAIDAVFR